MTKIKDRVNKKMILIPDTEDISSIKFRDAKFEQLIKESKLIRRSVNYVEFESVTDFGSIRFIANDSNNYKIEIPLATAKIFDFVNDAELSNYQIDRLQRFVRNWIENNPFEYEIENTSIIDPYTNYSLTT